MNRKWIWYKDFLDPLQDMVWYWETFDDAKKVMALEWNIFQSRFTPWHDWKPSLKMAHCSFPFHTLARLETILKLWTTKTRGWHKDWPCFVHYPCLGTIWNSVKIRDDENNQDGILWTERVSVRNRNSHFCMIENDLEILDDNNTWMAKKWTCFSQNPCLGKIWKDPNIRDYEKTVMA